MSDTLIHDAQRLKELQALPLSRKILITQTRIIEWYQHFNGCVCVSFSGGKDSTVLLDIVRKIYPHVPAVFSNTGLEYPEIQKFVKGYDNVDIVIPEMRFDRVIQTYGYPLISKMVAQAIREARKIIIGKRYIETMRRRADLLGQREEFDKQMGKTNLSSMFNKHKYLPLASLPFLVSGKCCYVMKKSPIAKYERSKQLRPIIATLAQESQQRKAAWIMNGCNAFNSPNPSSQPMSFWTEQDVLQYIQEYGLKIASVYGEIVGEPGNLHCTGCDRTGCIFCAFGAHLEKGETRFQRLKQTHPKHYNYCIGGGEWADNPFYDPDAPEYDGEWKNWNPKQIWTCNSKGLGMGKVFDMVNELYGKELYKW